MYSCGGVLSVTPSVGLPPGPGSDQLITQEKPNQRSSAVISRQISSYFERPWRRWTKSTVRWLYSAPVKLINRSPPQAPNLRLKKSRCPKDSTAICPCVAHGDLLRVVVRR